MLFCHTQLASQKALKPKKNRLVSASQSGKRELVNRSATLRKLIKNTKSKLAPTEQQIIDAVNDIFPKPRSKTSKEKLNATSGEIASAKLMVEAKVRETLEDWEQGGHGYINQTKNDGIVQVYLKNFNSLSIEKKGGKHWKSRAVDAIRKKIRNANNGWSRVSDKL